MLTATEQPTATTPDEVLAQGRARVRELADTLMPGERLYLVFTSDGFVIPPWQAYARAFTHRDADMLVHGHLATRGEWRGRGFCVVFDDLHVACNVTEAGREAKATPAQMIGSYLAELAAIGVHEIGHTATFPQPTLAETPQVLQTCAVNFERSEKRQQSADPHPLLPWWQHDHKWIRCVLHLLNRAEQAGFCAPTHIALALWVYGLSPALRYGEALGDEPERLAHVPVRELVNTPPPKRFAALWRADLLRWFEANPNAEQVLIDDLCRDLKMEP